MTLNQRTTLSGRSLAIDLPSGRQQRTYRTPWAAKQAWRYWSAEAGRLWHEARAKAAAEAERKRAADALRPRTFEVGRTVIRSGPGRGGFVVEVREFDDIVSSRHFMDPITASQPSETVRRWQAAMTAAAASPIAAVRRWAAIHAWPTGSRLGLPVIMPPVDDFWKYDVWPALPGEQPIGFMRGMRGPLIFAGEPPADAAWMAHRDDCGPSMGPWQINEVGLTGWERPEGLP